MSHMDPSVHLLRQLPADLGSLPASKGIYVDRTSGAVRLEGLPVSGETALQLLCSGYVEVGRTLSETWVLTITDAGRGLLREVGA